MGGCDRHILCSRASIEHLWVENMILFKLDYSCLKYLFSSLFEPCMMINLSLFCNVYSHITRKLFFLLYDDDESSCDVYKYFYASNKSFIILLLFYSVKLENFFYYMY